MFSVMKAVAVAYSLVIGSSAELMPPPDLVPIDVNGYVISPIPNRIADGLPLCEKEQCQEEDENCAICNIFSIAENNNTFAYFSKKQSYLIPNDEKPGFDSYQRNLTKCYTVKKLAEIAIANSDVNSSIGEVDFVRCNVDRSVYSGNKYIRKLHRLLEAVFFIKAKIAEIDDGSACQLVENQFVQLIKKCQIDIDALGAKDQENEVEKNEIIGGATAGALAILTATITAIVKQCRKCQKEKIIAADATGLEMNTNQENDVNPDEDPFGTNELNEEPNDFTKQNNEEGQSTP